MAKINKVLARELLAAHTPRFFLFSPGVDSNILKLSKVAFPPTVLQEEKGKSSRKTDFMSGTVVLEKGPKGMSVVFSIDAAVKEERVRMLRKTLKENAGIQMPVEARKIVRGNAAGNPDDVPEQQTDAQAFWAVAIAVDEQIRALEVLHPKEGEKFRAKLALFVDAVKSAEAVNADVEYPTVPVQKLGALMERLPVKATSEQKHISEKAAFKRALDAFLPTVAKLEVMDARAHAALLPLFEDVRDRAEREKFVKATAKLAKVAAAFEKALGVALSSAEEPVPKGTGAKPGEHKALVRNVEALLNEADPLFEQVGKFGELRTMYARAVELGVALSFVEAAEILKTVKSDMSFMLTEHTVFTTRQGLLDSLFEQAEDLTGPKLHEPSLGSLRQLAAGGAALARKGRLEEAISGIQTVDQKVRELLTERSTFVEAAEETASLLHTAEGTLVPNDFDPLEAKYLSSFDTFEGGEAGKAYDAVTNAGADLKRALRAQGTATESGAKVTEMTTGASREARRLRFKLRMDAVQKALPTVKKSDPQLAGKLENGLALATALREKSLTQAEGELQKLVLLLEPLRRGVKQDGGNASAENGSAPTQPQTRADWTKQIDESGLLAKLKPGKELARGGYGAVFVLEPETPKNKNDPPGPSLVFKEALNEEGRAGIEEEVELYEKLGDHPNLVKCLGIREVKGRKGMIMEQVQGRTSDEFLQNMKSRLVSGAISQEEFWATIQYTIGKTMSALAHIHSKGLAHNDIKPGNVMVDEVTGDVKVIDVGEANALGRKVEGVANPIFQAPENVAGTGSSSQTDAFAAGGIAMGVLEGGQDASFHFGNRDVMEGTSRSDQSDAILAYGALLGDDADEAAVKQVSPDKAVRRVNAKGEDDPNGEILTQDPGKSASKSAFTEFMNAVMHPDPTRRLSPEQALNHPFLRDALLPDEAVKKLIQKTAKDTTSEQSKEKLGLSNKVSEKAYADTTVVTVRAALKTFAADQIEPNQLLTERQRFMDLRESNALSEGLMRLSVATLRTLVDRAVVKDGPAWFEQNRDLEAHEAVLRDLSSLVAPIDQALAALEKRIKAEGAGVAEDATLDEAAVEKRIEALGGVVRNIRLETSKLGNLTALPLADQAGGGLALRQRVIRAQAGVAAERAILARLAQALKDGGATREKTAALTSLSKSLANHIKALSEVGKEVEGMLGTIKERFQEETTRAESFGKAARHGRRALKTLVDNHKVAGRAHQAEATKPRDTADAAEAFQKTREEFDKLQDTYKLAVEKHRSDLQKIADVLTRLERSVGGAAPTGFADPAAALKALTDALTEYRDVLKTA